jgi:hypothetical protein
MGHASALGSQCPSRIITIIIRGLHLTIEIGLLRFPVPDVETFLMRSIPLAVVKELLAPPPSESACPQTINRHTFTQSSFYEPLRRTNRLRATNKIAASEVRPPHAVRDLET